MVNADITDNGSTYTSNSATSGGAIYINDNQLNAIASAFINNEAGNAGAIRIENGTLDDDGCMYNGNQATSTNGGAIRVVAGTLECNGSKFTENIGNHGGAIRIESGIISAQIVSATFTNNKTSDTGSAYNGGAINAQDSVTVTGCEFSGNTAAYGTGGALYITAPTAEEGEEQTSSVLTVSNSTFWTNGAVSGGAVGVGSNSQLNVAGSDFGG